MFEADGLQSWPTFLPQNRASRVTLEFSHGNIFINGALTYIMWLNPVQRFIYKHIFPLTERKDTSIGKSHIISCW